MNIILPSEVDPTRKRPLEYFFINLFKGHVYPKPGVFGAWTEIAEKHRRVAMEIDSDETHWTICNYYNLGSKHLQEIFAKLKIDTVFSVHASTRLPPQPFKVYPFPHYLYNIGEGLSQRNLLCSFIGEMPNRTRRTLFQHYAGKPGYYMKGKIEFHFKQSPLREDQATQNYKEVLGRSRFSACPRGYGPGTIRFWESLSYGAIPVLICDGSVLPPLWDWDKTIVRISEKEFNERPEVLDERLQKISPAWEESLRKNCLAAFKHVYNEETLSEYIRNQCCQC